MPTFRTIGCLWHLRYRLLVGIIRFDIFLLSVFRCKMSCSHGSGDLGTLMVLWRFPKIGIPLNHPPGIFHEINHPALGVSPWLWKPPWSPALVPIYRMMVPSYLRMFSVPRCPYGLNGPSWDPVGNRLISPVVLQSGPQMIDMWKFAPMRFAKF